MQDLLDQGIAAVKAGQREHARDLLMRVVEQDDENALAWLWLSGVVDSLDDREVCLENVLSLEPHNEMARKGLDILRRQKAEQLMRLGVRHVAPSHCSGGEAIGIFADVFGSRFLKSGVGRVLTVDDLDLSPVTV